MNTSVEPLKEESGVETLIRQELLHQLFERHADLRPTAVAVVCGTEELTYGGLDRRSNQISHELRTHGVGRDDKAAFLLPRSIQVYCALLGILKSGAAYVPIDSEYPEDRVRFILEDCGAKVLLTTRAMAARAGEFKGVVILLDDEGGNIFRQPVARLANGETGATPNDLCYVIYTSGTTGRPKGVEIEHRSACHLARAEGELFHVESVDRVYQGFSIAFDASVEEVWLAFFAGATLVAGTAEMHRSGAGLAGALTKAGVTVLSCVPTLLAMIEEDMPSIRLLILGGEACPPGLVARWWRPWRLVFNTYGPTEATVIATCAECHPDKPVTIGRTIPNYHACILDEALQPAPTGAAGELCLGGIGLARGYLGRPELTAEKFISNPRPDAEGRFARLYRTGDLARWTEEGEIEFLGRVDSQVKIRGFRVELAEIESVMLGQTGVKAAACAWREDAPGNPQLVGYIVPLTGSMLDLNWLRAELQARLPVYMVPAIFEVLPELPTLPSGKVDRKNLPVPIGSASTSARNCAPPRTAKERELFRVWELMLAPQQVSRGDHFFLDLGGHSLLAARMVSELRKKPGWEQISMLDIYQLPVLKDLAAEFERRAEKEAINSQPAEIPQARADSKPKGMPLLRHFLCGAAQLFSLGIILTFSALQWLAPYVVFTLLRDVVDEFDYFWPVLLALASLVVLYPLMVVVPIVVKWLVIGRYKPGSYPLWGWFYFRWWFATSIEAAVPVGYLAGTPLLNIYLRMMGARIGRNVHLDSDAFVAYDLLEIGDDTSINVDSNLLGYTVENGMLRIGRVRIGKSCYVGARSAVQENATMEDGSSLEDLSLLTRGSTIPAGETWVGSPAFRKSVARNTDAPKEETHTVCRARRFAFGCLHALGLLLFPVLVTSAIFPGIILMNELNYIDPYYWYLCLSPLVALSFVVLLSLEIAALKWLLLGRIKSGTYPLHSFYYLRKWFVDQTMDLSLDVLGPLYGSIYLAPWYKLLGAKVGKGAEVSTASFISPDLLHLGEDSFIADSVSLGAPRIRNGFMTIGENRIGRKTFIGNSAMLPPGANIGDDSLIGCLSAPPTDAAEASRENATWMGSPAMFLPQRQQTTRFSVETTFKPTPKLRAQRAIIEFVRVILPSTCFIILLSLMFSGMLLLLDDYTLFETLIRVPFLYIGCGIAATGATILAKWLLVWRYHPGEKPLWSTFLWRNELINALHEHLAEPFLVGALTGTPFVCWYFRLLGARIGRRVYMETTDFSEFDLARLGNEVTLNADCTIQTHLFEDRVMKMSTVEIDDGATVGAGSLVLYDTKMERGSSLGDLSLLMKGETLPADTAWEGIPARPRDTKQA